jgi:mRNA-degrading endonuclease RelE of RelBE toxin-antitoxin system
MNFETTDLFDRQAKRLSKKYRDFKTDLQHFVQDFDQMHPQSVVIRKNLHKIRLANSSKNKGKRAGYRIYYYLKLEETVYLLTIYDKAEISMIDEELLADLIEGL